MNKHRSVDGDRQRGVTNIYKNILGKWIVLILRCLRLQHQLLHRYLRRRQFLRRRYRALLNRQFWTLPQLPHYLFLTRLSVYCVSGREFS